MIKLIQFYPHFGLPNASPFCLKLETYLRMAKIPYEVVTKSDPRKAPKGKFPIIIDNDRTIADSGMIIDYLKSTYGDTLDKNLSEHQKAQSLCIQRLLDEHLYWIMVYSRWFDPDFWPSTKEIFFGRLPAISKYFISTLIRKKTQRDMYGHGMGRHTTKEIYAMGEQDLHALSVLLNDQPYFCGQEPTTIDASAYGFLANILYPPLATPLQHYMRTQQNLVAYCERMKTQFYAKPD